MFIKLFKMQVYYTYLFEHFLQEKSHVEKWEKMQIKHYDTLKDLFGGNRATGKGPTTTKERLQ